MWTRGLLKQNGRVAFHRNYFSCVVVCLITAFLGGSVSNFSFNVNVEESSQSYYSAATPEELIAQIEAMLARITPAMWTTFFMAALIGTLIGFGIAIMISNVVIVGCNRYFLENREHKTEIVKMFHSFQGGRYSTTIWVMFLRTLFIWGWSLLLVVPGIIKSYSYMLVPYILAENTYLDRKRVFELSSEMMRGHKWEAFVLGLSFIGWHIIGGISGGLVSLFYVNPYLNATYAEFYTAIKSEALARGIASPDELPGVGEPETI